MKHSCSTSKTRIARSPRGATIALALGIGFMPLSACNTSQVFTHGAVVTQDQIDLIPVGSSKDQVLLALGTPSTTGQFDEEAYYYITQRQEKTYSFQKGRIVDQRVLAVYFDQNTETVSHVANYGLKDGRIFDFITRATPTGGRDLTFLGQIFSSAGKKAAPGSTPSSIPHDGIAKF